MAETPAAAAAPLPQPPREGGEEPVEAPRSPQEAAQQAPETKERARITLTVARDLGSRSRSLQARFIALVGALNEVGIDGTESAGLRGELNAAFAQLRDAAPMVDAAIAQIEGVATALEDL